MCGRYYLPEEDLPAEWLKILQVLGTAPAPEHAKIGGEVSPGDIVPVIANSRKLTPRPFFMQWGYHVSQKLIFNARSETAAEKGLFSNGTATRRCLMPCLGYYEWEKRLENETVQASFLLQEQNTPAAGGSLRRIKYGIFPEAEGLMYLAGLYRFEKDTPVFTVLTRPAAPEIQFIHPRMPVLFSGRHAAEWLDMRRDYRDLLSLAPERMLCRPQ